ncbi:MAG: hypothetical protein IVW54_22010 [Candidatus Binataceae bacterium]|nr:hypothetical protein [Candidatus Binataceae bacterium]
MASKAWDPPAPGALEAKAAITLAIGYGRDHPTSRISRSGTSVNCCATTFHHIFRKAEGTHHIAIGRALPVHIADILLAGRARVAELQTDTFAVLDIALAIGDSVINEATRLGAERVTLVLANHEGRLWIRQGIQMKTKRRYCGKHLDRCQERNNSDQSVHGVLSQGLIQYYHDQTGYVDSLRRMGSISAPKLPSIVNIGSQSGQVFR